MHCRIFEGTVGTYCAERTLLPLGPELSEAPCKLQGKLKFMVCKSAAVYALSHGCQSRLTVRGIQLLSHLQ